MNQKYKDLHYFLYKILNHNHSFYNNTLDIFLISKSHSHVNIAYDNVIKDIAILFILKLHSHLKRIYAKWKEVQGILLFSIFVDIMVIIILFILLK